MHDVVCDEHWGKEHPGTLNENASLGSLQLRNMCWARVAKIFHQIRKDFLFRFFYSPHEAVRSWEHLTPRDLILSNVLFVEWDLSYCAPLQGTFNDIPWKRHSPVSPFARAHHGRTSRSWKKHHSHWATSSLTFVLVFYTAEWFAPAINEETKSRTLIRQRSLRINEDLRGSLHFTYRHCHYLRM